MSPPIPKAAGVALVGAGAWGKQLARCFQQLHALQMIVVPTDNQEHAELRARFPDIRLEGSFSAALDDPSIDKVAIAAPSALHFQLAKAALLAQKHVFVEKPLCLNARDAEELATLAERTSRTLMVGHLLQYHPCVVKLRALVADGKLGQLLTITSTRLNLGKFRKDENALYSFAPHDVSLILSLLGDRLPQSVRCVGASYLNRNVADSTITTLRFTGGALAQLHVSWLNPFKEQKLTLVGTKGMAVFDDMRPWAEKLAFYREYIDWQREREPVVAKAEREPIVVPEIEPLLAECAHFLDACRDRCSPLTDGREGLRVMQVLDMAQRSLEQDGERVTSSEWASGEPGYFVHPTAFVDESAEIGKGSKIWHFCHVMAKVRLGERCSLGQNVSVASGVVLGNNVKVQNNVSLYTGTLVEDDVFLGPGCVLTNVTNPRAQVSRRSLYEMTLLRRGATVGANATILCGITLGRYCFVAAGAVVTKDVPDYALMIGNPARQRGWMSRHGHRLKAGPEGVMVCPESGLKYRVISPGQLKCLDLDEETPLPDSLRVGRKTYDELKV